MGRPGRSGAETLPRVLAGLLVPIAGILLLTFYFSNRPEDTEAVARVPAGRNSPRAATSAGSTQQPGGVRPKN